MSCGERATATAARTTRRNTKASGLAANVSTARRENQTRRRFAIATSAASANASPRPYGKAAVTIEAAATTAKNRETQGLVSPQVRRTTRLNAAADAATLITASSRIPTRAASG